MGLLPGTVLGLSCINGFSKRRQIANSRSHILPRDVGDVLKI
jgi:hypothetical protein